MNPRRALQDWLSSLTGIELERGGVTKTLWSVVDERCKELGCDLEAYLHRARSPGNDEIELLANAITVVYTWFYRDRGQLAAVEEILRERASRSVTRIWVPGCATGEDTYSIALLARHLEAPVEILGTDINTRALERARAARYHKLALRELSANEVSQFERHADGTFGVPRNVRGSVRFQRHNLAEPVPSLDGSDNWDLILCRNVLIYFRPESALQAFDRMTRALTNDGTLILGASEVVYDVPDCLEALYVAGRLVLRKSTEPRVRARTALPVPAPAAVPHSARGAHHAPLPALPKQAGALALDVHPNTQDDEEQRLLDAGHTLLDGGQLSEALSQYERLTERFATFADGHMYQGIARYLCGSVDRAAHDLRAALFLDEELWPAAFYLALSYESMGLPTEALREYRHVVRLCERKPEIVRKHPLLAGWHTDMLDLARRRATGDGSSSSQLRPQRGHG